MTTTTPGPTPAHPAERVSLPRELANFLIELAIALQNHAVYPPGHPFLERSAQAVIGRLDGLLLDRGSLSFGVARDRLVIEGVATEPENPVLSGLAGRLHRHRVGAVSITRGVTAEEVAQVLSALAVEAELSGPLLADGRGPALAGVRLHPLSFANLELTGGGEGDAAGVGEAAEHAARAPQLWVGLARAALAAGEAGMASPQAEEDAPTPEPAAVAAAINEHAHAAAYDQVIVGYLLQLAEELRSGGGRGAQEVRRRLSRMIVGLSPEALRRLVDMSGDQGQRGRFLMDASHGFAADAVVRLVEATAEARNEGISEAMLRLLSKLAQHATHAPSATAGGGASGALREQVQRLVTGWTLDDPNPEGYRSALEGLAKLASPGPPVRGSHEPEPLRILKMALEVDTVGEMCWAALAEADARGELPAVVEVLAEAPAESAAAEALWGTVASAANLRALLRLGSEAAPALEKLAARLGPAASASALMDELVESDSRTVRRAALARLTGMRRHAAVEAQRRLGDERWYVIRNLLYLLGEVRAVPRTGTMQRFLRHEDERVRREAFKLALRNPEDRSQALSAGLHDPDAQVQRVSLAECARGCPPAVVPQLCARIADPGTDPELRVSAVHALGASREPLALRTLLRLADGGRTLLGKRRLAPPSPLLAAAVAALASGWWDDVEATEVVSRARLSADAAVRGAAGARSEG